MWWSHVDEWSLVVVVVVGVMLVVVVGGVLGKTLCVWARVLICAHAQGGSDQGTMYVCGEDRVHSGNISGCLAQHWPFLLQTTPIHQDNTPFIWPQPEENWRRPSGAMPPLARPCHRKCFAPVQLSPPAGPQGPGLPGDYCSGPEWRPQLYYTARHAAAEKNNFNIKDNSEW